MTVVKHGLTVASDSTQITWEAPLRLAFVRYSRGAILSRQDGTFLVDGLTSWIGESRGPFAVLAD